MGKKTTMDTHSLKEMLSPILVLPRKFRSSLKANQEFALEVEKLVYIGEERKPDIIVDPVALRQNSSIFLRQSQ
jgi:hypothetical protein